MFNKGEVKASTFTPNIKTKKNRKKREKEKQEELDMNIHSLLEREEEKE